MNYLEHMRSRGLAPVAAVVAILVGLCGFMLIVALVTPTLAGVAWLVTGLPGNFGDFFARTTRFDIPQGVWVAHLSLALLTVVSVAVGHWVLKLPRDQFLSVQPGIRWRYLLVVAVMVAPIMAVAAWAMMFSAKELNPQPGFWAFAIPIVLFSGLQGAGEEFFFRGLLPLSLSVVMRPWPAIIGSSLVFAFLHGQQSLPLFADRFAFGLVAGGLTLLTGGLEAAIAIHGVNNLLAFGGWGLFATVAQARTMSDITWAQCGIDVALYVVVAAVAWWVARRMNVATTLSPDLASRLQVR